MSPPEKSITLKVRIRELEQSIERLLASLGLNELKESKKLSREAVDAWDTVDQHIALDSTHWLRRGQKLEQTLKDTISLGDEIVSYKGTMRGTILSFIGANPFKEQIQRLENELREQRDYFTACLGPGMWNSTGYSNYIEKHGDDFTNSTVERTSRDVYNYHGTTYNTYN
ncbi:hypothetical protein V5O48_007302 [Marasmius crinis-equi]|uniref:Uncharacterized protein n=1 Tax=Marasmius crinis-equi TaxID=585013 RepID=A0ABR3FH35_9AGAR